MDWKVSLVTCAVLAVTVMPGLVSADHRPMTHDDRQGPGTASADAATTVDIVDALKAVAGNPKGVRATFAKGQCVTGHYVPSDKAADFTRSPTFTQPSNVIARFAVSGGNPKVADTNKATLRGFSMRLGPEGGRSDLLVENAPVHFAKDVTQMLAFLRAHIPGPDGHPDAEKLKAFSEANPETLNQAHFLASRPLPGSYAGIVFWGIHSFTATNAKGKTQTFKWKVVPAAGEITLTEDEAKAKPSDPTMDVTQRWPDEDSRPTVRLGTVEITGLEPNETCDGSIFNPANLADGIGAPKDEIFSARRFAYVLSLSKRR